MRCEEYEPNIIAHVLGELSPLAARDCQVHIESCAQCRQAYESCLGLTQAAKARLEPGPTAQELGSMSQALDHFIDSRWPEHVGAREEPRVSKSATWRDFWFGRRAKLCLAACAIVAVGIAAWTLSPQHAAEHVRMAQSHPRALAAPHRVIHSRPVVPPVARQVAIAPEPERKHKHSTDLWVTRKRPASARQRHHLYVAVGQKANPPEPQQMQTASISPEAAYQAGQLLGAGLSVLAETARPETCMKLSTKVRGLILPITVKSKGESNEKDNSSGPGDRVNGSADPSGTVCIEAIRETGRLSSTCI